jgi:hypothetical protein
LPPVGFFAAFAFVLAEPLACPDELDELLELCPPMGTATISTASAPASHRRNHSAGTGELMNFISSL